jgi:hypothetical protein
MKARILAASLGKVGSALRRAAAKAGPVRKRLSTACRQSNPEQMATDPWEGDIPGRYRPGEVKKGKVTKITNFGVFVADVDQQAALDLAGHHAGDGVALLVPDEDSVPLLLPPRLAVAQDHGAGLVLQRLQQDLDRRAGLGRDDPAEAVVVPLAQLDGALTLVVPLIGPELPVAGPGPMPGKP